MNKLEIHQNKVDQQSMEDILWMRQIQAHQNTQAIQMNRMVEDLEAMRGVVTA